MTHDKQFLNVIYWNANGIRDKIHMLYDYLVLNHIDVACVCETFLKSHHILNKHPDFDYHRNDRPDDRMKGGVLIIINRRIKYKLLPYLHTHLIENIGVEITTKGGCIQIFTCYLPGGTRQQMIQTYLRRDISTLTLRPSTFFALGDFNAKHRHWNNVRANVAGTILYEQMQRNCFYVLHPPTHTHFPSDLQKQPSTIDIGLTNSLFPVDIPETTPMSSDHNIVKFTIHLGSDVEFDNPHLIYSFKKANWPLYQKYITDNLAGFDLNHNNIHNTNQVDDLIDKLTSTIQLAKRKAIPQIIPDRYGLCLTPEIRDKMHQCKIIQRRCQRAQNLQRKMELKAASNRLHKEICKDINHLRNIDWSHKLREIPTDGNRIELFQVAKFIRRRGKDIPPLKVGDEIFATPQEKADCLAETFANAHSNPLATNQPAFTRSIENAVNEILSSGIDPNSVQLPPIQDTDDYIRKLKNRKAPGMDQINNTLLKNLPRPGVLLLHLIMICCIKLCYFPPQWKIGIVAAIPKPGKPPTCPKSFRPISLLSALSKILEMHILKPIRLHLETSKIIPDDQYGFVRGKSSVGQLHRVTSHIKNQLEAGCSTGMILLDVERAFDRVWHAGLLYKLLHTNFPITP